MDATLAFSDSVSRARVARNRAAWARFVGSEMGRCPYCRHDAVEHYVTTEQPHIFRPAERRELSGATRLYRCTETGMLLRRISVARDSQITSAFCLECSIERDTAQVQCFAESIGIGEIIGWKHGI